MRRLYFTFAILLAGLLTACSSSGVRLPQSPLTAMLERRSGLIAYIGPDGNVYTSDQGGGKLTMLTNDAHPPQDGVRRFYDFPAWSSEDHRLAFVGFVLYEDGRSESTVYATDEDGENPVAIFASDLHIPFYLYWSPAANYVSFLSSIRGSSSLAMHVAPADGGESSVVNTGQPLYWAWSPQGMEVMAHVGGSAAVNPNEARLSRLQIDPEVREIGLGIAPTNFQAPAYSPDGEFVLLAGDGGGGRQQLMLTDARGVVQRTLMDGYEGSIAFAWAPRGDRAAVITGQPTSQALIGSLSFLDLETPSEPEITETEAEEVIGFFWAPDGKKLAYFRPVVMSNQQEGQEASQSAQGGQVLLFELHVVEVASGESKRIALFQPTQGFLNLFPFFDQYQRSTTIWSPDSNYLVVSAIASEDTQGLFIVPASGNFEPRFLAPARVGFWSWE